MVRPFEKPCAEGGATLGLKSFHIRAQKGLEGLTGSKKGLLGIKRVYFFEPLRPFLFLTFCIFDLLQFRPFYLRPFAESTLDLF